MAGATSLSKPLIVDESPRSLGSRLNPDKAIEASYGSGLYQLRVFFLIGSLFIVNVPGIQIQVFVGPKMVDDESIPDFTHEVMSASQSLLFVGWAVGSVCTGLAGDRFGRWAVSYALNLGFVLAYACSVLAASANSVLLFRLSLLAAGFCIPVLAASYALVQESMPSRLRVSVTAAVNVGFSAGLGLMALICGYVTRQTDWQSETFLFLVPAAVLMLGAPFIHESLHVLMLQGQHDAAGRVTEAIAHTNSAHVDMRACLDIDEFEEPQLGLASVASRKLVAESPMDPIKMLLTSSHLRLRLLATSVCWVALNLGYYGLTFCAGSLSANVYLNVFLFALADVAGFLLPMAIVPLVGRRRFQMACFALAAASLGLCGVLTHSSWQVVACAAAGRLFIDMGFFTIWIISVEVFPTGCRSTAMGLCNGASRLLGLLAPLLGMFPASVVCPFYGALCALGLLATSALPETEDWQLSQVQS